MKTRNILLFAVLLVGLFLAGAVQVRAQLSPEPRQGSENNGYAVPWWAVSGGGESQGGGYIVSSAIGQASASPSMQGGQFAVQGGFFSGWMEAARLFLPVIVR